MTAHAVLQQKYRDEARARSEAETELSEVKKGLAELDDLKRQLEELKVKHEKDVSDARAESFAEAKKKIVEHYQGQVAEISEDGFRRGAKIYFQKGIAQGYGLGLDAGSVPTNSDLRAVPNIELPEIEIPEEEDEEVAENEEVGAAENVASPKE